MPSIADNTSRTPSKKRAKSKVSDAIDVICRHAFDRGLDEDSLRTLVQIAARKTQLDQTSVATLVQNLYPSQQVSEDVVVTVVGALGQGKGKPSPGIQNGLVKWLTFVYEILEDPRTLSRLYGVLFGMLDMISIRTSLCHLLSLITRRKHVKPFRIQQLLELSRSLGNEPAIQGLLRIYKDYYPDIILGSTATSRRSFPARPDPEWRARILAVQEASARTNESQSKQHNGFRVLRKGPKRSKVSVIPEVHTFHANETSVTLEEIDTVTDFVEKLDRIELPGQLISFLTDPLLQKYLMLKQSERASRRINLWLSIYLEEEYEAVRRGTGTSEYLGELLAGLHKQTQYTKTLLPITSTFLKAYLMVWDGVKDVDAIFGLLSYIQLQPFDDAYNTFLGPAENAFVVQSPEAYCKLLSFYTNLLRHWMAEATPQPSDPIQLATGSPDQQALEELVAHVSKMSSSLLLSIPTASNAPLISSILSFYEILSFSSHPRVVPILLPSLQLAYFLAQSHALATVSRTYGIYANYKTAFDKHPKPIQSYYLVSVTNSFNMVLRDIYNSLWGSKALLAVESKSHGFLCMPPLRASFQIYLGDLDHEYAVGLAFGLSHNASLASLSAAAWRSLEEAEIDDKGYDRDYVTWHTGPVSQRKVEVLSKNGGVSVSWDQYRIHVLKWMADRGCSGFKDLLSATVSNIKGRA
ncbi:Mis6-domain-containing protein [Lindgomyces ingoldianus]|uniref:Mis6-domain-containing protein n=1 Tax=Lindgomyces ingoldianus TaxID=673940 RepID=A0ACB6QAL9_9PLEO|nr:Mis6-domain-containing protein [Lindgomyces ingoldianus]KAF2463628.1 Mis6-domain-containing protein [Lindgomyces ingoldianus]